jgi:2-polyprenyl-3-methyl-5-hydroxy-6-metoxy-1,4-benzoquinol methylase
LEKSNLALNYWEKKILIWEKYRYSKFLFFYPMSWSVRSRLHHAEKFLSKNVKHNWKVCELGCGSGILAKKIAPLVGSFHGIDIAKNAIELAKYRNRNNSSTFEAMDISSKEFEEYDLFIFLGLTDWLSLDQMNDLFRKINSKCILFSFTEVKVISRWNPYRYYRAYTDRKSQKFSYVANSYSEECINEILKRNGYEINIIQKASLFNPGVLVWATR